MKRRRRGGPKAPHIPRLARLVAAVAPFLGLAPTAASGQALRLENENVYGFALFDILEVAPALDGRPVGWDMIASIGREYDRFWITSDGDLSTSTRSGEVDVQGLYSRMIGSYWNLQAGARVELSYGEDVTSTRGHVTFGLQGLAPYWFELTPQLYVSQDGDVAAALEASYDLFVTQRLILQPRLDAAAAWQEVTDWGVGSGLNSIVLQARLRYEIRREFAPYVGIRWSRLLGGTADMALAEGDDVREIGFVACFRVWR